MTTEYQTISYQQDSRVGMLCLNRPAVRNAINPQMIGEVTELCHRLRAAEEKPRVLILEGHGEVFSAGADLTWMKSMIDFSEEENRADAYKLFLMFKALLELPMLVVGKAHGAVYGGGLGMLAICDVVWAEEKTQFCLSEVKLGLSPSVIAPFLLRKAARGQLWPLMTTGRVFDVAEAKALGLVHHSYKNNVDAQVLIQDLLSCAPQAVAATKKLLRDLHQDLNLPQVVDQVVATIASLRVSDEGQNGLKAFLSKSTPPWRSR